MALKTREGATDSLQGKMTSLRARLKEMGSVLVAYSGGVDSAFLAVVAYDELGDRALAVTASSPSLAPSELEYAVSLAQRRSIAHRVIETAELQRADYIENNSNRCYFCKDELYTHLKNLAADEGFAWIANGTNADDLGDFRPGLKAAEQYGVRSPLVEAGLGKSEIRELSRDIGLDAWDKPAQACLSSRIPYGTPVSVEPLGRIAKAEEFLRRLGIRQLRVRHHDTIARIEIGPQDFSVLIDDDVRQRVTRYFRSIGYAYVALDLDGFRSGSLNETLKAPGNGKTG